MWTQASGTTTVTRFGYDGDQVWADLAGDNSLQMRYLRGDEADQLFARISGAGVAAWYLTDWEGSVRKLTDGSGSLTDTITYDGFGNVTAETNATLGGAYKYDGMRFDAETGDYSTWGRTDAPGVGRWLQQDPLEFDAGDPNLYRDVGNSPSDYTDPSGLWLTVGGRSIKKATDIDPAYSNNQTAEMMVLVLVTSPSNTTYASKNTFDLDLRLRTAILHYAQSLNGAVDFPSGNVPAGELPNKAIAPRSSKYWRTQHGQIFVTVHLSRSSCGAF